ncbi:MAG: CBS domain-containing protein [Acidobacteriota bacterium]|nr:CBS domain-containing protein [Acidobacteriota bacterium]MDQ3419564.1 CBS domain-containing protein [Acidobacteriota bacterium]
MANCSEVMTREPACCEPGDSISRVAGIMKREDVGSVPVVESHEDKKLIGIVTDRDLVVKVLAEGADMERSTVRDAMTPDPASCRENDPIEKAVKLMSERQVRRMPIVDDQGRLSGIIAQADVATRVSQDATTGELVEAISEPGTTRQ